eukprot:2284244-Amphidinium_carterae.1
METPVSKLSAASAAEAETLESKFRRKPKTSIANLVQVAIRQNCQGMSHYETDQLVVDGLTLRQRVTRDKEQKERDPNGIVMGKAYWEGLRRMYTADSSELKSLGPVNVDAVAPKLFEAISKTRLRIPDRRALAEYCSRTESVNRDEAVAIMKTMCTLDPCKHPEQKDCLMECLSLLARSQLETECAAQYQVMAKRFDSIALQAKIRNREGWLSHDVDVEAYLGVVNTGIDAHEWLSQNEGLHKLVLPQAALKAVLALEADRPWADVKNELVEVMESSLFGRRVFAFAAMEGIKAAVDEAVVEQEKKLLKEQNITVKVMRTHVLECLALCEAVPGAKTLEAQREVPIRYRGQTVQVQVRSLEEQCRLAMHAVAKGIAAEKGLLPGLPMETVLCDGISSGSKGRVEAAVVQKAKSARAMLKERVENAKNPCAETVQELCVKTLDPKRRQ